MRIAAIELPARHGEPEAQFLALDRALAALPPGGPTLAVLPELALTGYVSADGDFDMSPFAETLNGPLLRRVAGIAIERQVAVLVSWVERDRGRCFNSAAIIDESGCVALHYRKRHPWFPEAWASPGDLGVPLVSLRGCRVAVAVCFDLHFLSAEASECLDIVDALLFPSAWVDDDPHDARADLLPALARRHGCAVVNANWGVGSPMVRGQGGSRIIGGDGVTIARAPGVGGVHVVTASLPVRRALPAAPGAVKRPGS